MSSLIQNLFPSPRGQASRRLRAFLAIRGLVIASAIVVFLGACSQPASQPTVIPSVVVAPTAAPLPPSPTVVADTVGPLPAIPIESGDRARGAKLFSRVGCIGCHMVKGVGGNVGPNLTEVANRAPDRAEVQGLEIPELYFVQSVVYPKAYVVDGFNPVMPDWKGLQLSEQDLADVVAYLRTLDGQ